MSRAEKEKELVFRIRNRLHEPEGQYNKAQLLKRITAGKYHGEEEISAPPYESWVKLSAHPLFYDAFIRRLLSSEYKSDELDELAVSRPKSHISGEKGKDSDLATRRLEGKEGKKNKTKQAKVDKDDLLKTRQIGELGEGTLHQSMIDELFGEDPPAEVPQNEAIFERTEAAGTNILKIDPLPPAETTIRSEPEPTLANDQGTIAMEVPRPQSPIPQQRQSRRKIIWLSVGVLLLVLLFQSGGENGKKIVEQKPEQETTIPISIREALGAPTNKEERIRALVLEADSLLSSDTQLFSIGAIQVLKEALLYDENSTSVLSKYAEAIARVASEMPDAQKWFSEFDRVTTKVRTSDPQASQIYRAEAILRLTQGKLDEARALALNAIESDPKGAENKIVLGDVSLSLGDAASASKILEEAVRFSPTNVRGRALLARAYLQLGNAAGARSEALEALKLNALHPVSYLILGQLADAQGQKKEARGLFETGGRLAKFASRSIPALSYVQLGRISEELGAKQDAEKSYRLAYFYDPEADAVLKEKISGLDTSSASLKKLAEEEEYGPSYFQEQAEGLLQQGKFPEAVRFFQAASLLSPKDGTALIRLGEVTEKVAGSYDDFRRVMNLYQRAIERDPSDALAYVRLGVLETEQYNLDRGFKLIKQAVALAPDDAETYVALGKHYYKRQDYNEALNQFLKAAELSPQNSEVLYYAGLLRLTIKKEAVKDAIPFFQQAYSLNPQNYDALVEWLKLKVLSYEKNFAIKFAKALIDKEPGNPNLYWALGEVYAVNREYRRAVTYYHKALDINNRLSKVRISLALALQAVGELDAAVAEYRLASLLDRRNSDGFYKAAELLFETKAYPRAEEVLKYLISVTPQYPGAHRLLARIYQSAKQREPAMSEMQKEVQNNPENYRFVLELAELYMEYEKYKEAVAELAKVTNLPSAAKAPEFKDDKVKGYLMLSRCYRLMGKPDSSESVIKLAIELEPNGVELHKELGYVYYSLQRDKEAVKSFEYYLNQNPAARDAENIRELIKQIQIEE